MKRGTEYFIRDSFESMDFDKVTLMLGKAFWCTGISKDEVLKGARNSALVVGAFLASGEQVGYARVISDKTRFAYICDVFVDERFRRMGVGQGMIDYMLQHPELSVVYQWLLATKDAHGVYAKSGFGPISNPINWMEIRHERVSR
jgi:GNAT superfamily N-acetyltransferase